MVVHLNISVNIFIGDSVIINIHHRNTTELEMINTVGVVLLNFLLIAILEMLCLNSDTLPVNVLIIQSLRSLHQ